MFGAHGRILRRGAGRRMPYSNRRLGPDWAAIFQITAGIPSPGV